MAEPFLLYGANGYTGRLITERACQLALAPILAGRSEQPLSEMAKQYSLESQVVDLADSDRLDEVLNAVPVVLHAAGPFRETARPMIEACLRTKTHYVDITGEIEVFERCARKDEEARQANIMLAPGAGFDVVPSDCLAAHVAGRLKGGHSLSLAMSGMSRASRGTTKTAAQYVGLGSYIRRGGKIAQLTEPLYQEFDFGEGLVRCMAVSWGDVSTAYHSTGIPDIDVFFPATKQMESAMSLGPIVGGFMRSRLGQWILRYQINKRAAGPDPDYRAQSHHVLLADLRDGMRNRVVSRLKTPEGYSLTAQTSVAMVQRILDGDWKPGFQTPSKAYGADFILEFDGVTREDLEL